MADSDGGVLERKEANSFSGNNNGKRMNSSGSQTVSNLMAKSQYCEKLQEWMWQYYCGYVSWQSWGTGLSFLPSLPTQATSGSLRAPTWGEDVPNADLHTWFTHSYGVPLTSFPSIDVPNGNTAANNTSERQVEINNQSQHVPVPLHQQQHGNVQQPGTEAEASRSVIQAINVTNKHHFSPSLDLCV